MVRFRFSAFSDEYAASLDGQIEGLLANRIRMTEVRGIDGKNVSDLTPAEAAEVKKRFDARGITVSAIGSPIGKIGISDPFEPHLDKLKNVCEIASVFGTERVRMFSFYTPEDKASCRGEVIDRMGKKLKECMGEPIHPGGEYKKYFDLVFWHEGLEDEKFMTGAEKTDIINRAIRLCGYFVIVTSEKMTAKDALSLYKSRDTSEKTFQGDKSYLGANRERVYSDESVETKIFIGFVATIIRSRMYTLLKDEMGRTERKQNYMTVPAAIKELEKIELLKGADNEYNLDYVVTATQKAILKAFDMTADHIHKQARAISSDLARVEIEAIEEANK